MRHCTVERIVSHLRLYLRMYFSVLALGVVVLPPAAAATREEMRRLDAAYPAGSVVLCHSEVAGSEMFPQPVSVTTRGRVVESAADRRVFDVSVTWLTKGSTSGLTLNFRMRQRSDEEGQYSLIDPDSMRVSWPGVGSEAVKTVLQGFRARMTDGEKFEPYSHTTIARFPGYIVLTPGEAPQFCSKEPPREDE